MTDDHAAAPDAPRHALWLDTLRGELRLGAAPRTPPGPGEVVVRVHAVAINPVDTMGWIARRTIYPWLRYPAVLGTDVAGVVIETAPDVEHVRVGDRVVGLAAGQERDRNSPAHGAFQTHVVLPATMTTRVPDGMSLADAVVLPLGAATAAVGLFQRDQLALDAPTTKAADHPETVLVWGASTSVGCNAVQLARHAGYRVIAAASPRHTPLLSRLGAEHVVDYRSEDHVPLVRDAVGDRAPAGILAIGAGSLRPCLRIARPYAGTVRIASTQPGPHTAVLGSLGGLLGISVSAIWGGTVTRDEVGPWLFNEFLPRALAAGSYLPAPPADVVGSRLEDIPPALPRLRRGVSARKLVVTLAPSHDPTPCKEQP